MTFTSDQDKAQKLDHSTLFDFLSFLFYKFVVNKHDVKWRPEEDSNL